MINPVAAPVPAISSAIASNLSVAPVAAPHTVTIKRKKKKVIPGQVQSAQMYSPVVTPTLDMSPAVAQAPAASSAAA